MLGLLANREKEEARDLALRLLPLMIAGQWTAASKRTKGGFDSRGWPHGVPCRTVRSGQKFGVAGRKKSAREK